MSGQKTSRMIIRIDNNLKEQFEKKCQEKGYNKSEIIRSLIQKFIFQNSKKST